MNTTLDFSKQKTSKNACQRFIDYVVSRKSNKTSVQTAKFDTLTGITIFASDFFFTPDELKIW